MQPGILHLHTYFLFPFSIDKAAVQDGHKEVWEKYTHWIDGLDEWLARDSQAAASPVVQALGPWRRNAYTRFDMDSPAYQDMVFFHPIVRRVFFDSTGAKALANGNQTESLLRCYTLPVEGLKFEAEDCTGRKASVDVTDLRLFLFANGIGILSIGVESSRISAREALWINEMMRKVYPSSGRQVREGRIPNRLAFVVEKDGKRADVVAEDFRHGEMIGFLPPLSRTITELLYFARYADQEYEPVLDERMIVYTFFAVDPSTVPSEYTQSDDYQVLLSRFLYVDRWGESYRYEPRFVERSMVRQTSRRWTHQGTYYGFTSYSSITACLGKFACDEHSLEEGFLIHRMFATRYYLMTVVALFYRVALLDFSERTALVSKQVYLDYEDGKLTPANIRLTTNLRSEFLHFSNYWCFDELANKDEEIEHFSLQCDQFRIDNMRREIDGELEKLSQSLEAYAIQRSTEAVNRLAMLSLIMGAGAVLTGFFGMNFGSDFAKLFFQPDAHTRTVHLVAITVVALFAFGALGFGFFMVVANWADYRSSLVPRRWMRRPGAAGGQSLKR